MILKFAGNSYIGVPAANSGSTVKELCTVFLWFMAAPQQDFTTFSLNSFNEKGANV